MQKTFIKVHSDFETQASADLKKLGPYEYSIHPETRALCYAIQFPKKSYFFDYYDMQKPWSELPQDFRTAWEIAILSPDFIFKAHNAFFEICIYNNVLVARLGWPEIPIEKWYCTAAKAAGCAIPRNLAGAGEVMRLAIQKDFDGHKAMMKLCKPTKAWKAWHDKKEKGWPVDDEAPEKFWNPITAPDDFKILYKYCKIDVKTESLLDDSLPDLCSWRQKLWWLDTKINLRGVAVDIPSVKKIISIMATEAKTMAKELDILTLGLVGSVKSNNQVKDFLKAEGIELPNLRAKTVQDFLDNGKMSGDAKALLNIRKALSKSSTAKYNVFLTNAARDGRIREILMPLAASTGRYGGLRIQPQNFPRGIIKDIETAIDDINGEDVETLKMLYGENLMPLFSSVLRGMFVPTKGKLLFVEDFNAIETRVLWWLAGHEDGLEIFRTGQDPYRVMASAIFGKPPEAITDDERQVGKAAVLGLGYQMGWKKFITSAWDVYRAHVDKDLSKAAVKIYRETHSPVVELWADYSRAAIAAVEEKGEAFRVGRVVFKYDKGFLWVTLPSGRKLAYKDPSVVFVEALSEGEGEVIGVYSDKWVKATDETRTIFSHERNGFVQQPRRKDDRVFMTQQLRYWATNSLTKKWNREAIYGGKWTENIVQAVSADLLKFAIMRAERAGFQVLMHSHDELVCEDFEGKRKIFKDEKGIPYCPEYRALMERTPEWAEGLPLKAGGWVGKRYKKG